MTTLSSLVVARQVASIDSVDEALARQVVRGGDLATCLLELGATSEEALVPVLAEAYAIPSANVGELPCAPDSVLRLVPPAVALRYGLYPFEERDGELHIAVAEPLPQAVEDDLGFALGAHLRQYVAPMVRIRQAIGRDYGVPLDRRFLRLLTKLEGGTDPGPSVPPSGDETAPLVEIAGAGTRGGTIVDRVVPPPPSSTQAIGTDEYAPPTIKHNTWPGMILTPSAESAEPPPLPPPPRTPVPEVLNGSDASTEASAVGFPTPTTPASMRSTPDAITLEAPLAPASTPPESPLPATPVPTSGPPSSAARPKPTPAGPPPGFIMEATMATAAQVEKRRRRKAEQLSSKVLLGWARRALGNTIPSDRVERRRGPLTPAVAELQFEDASTAEEALEVFFAFAKQYFEYAALFVVHGDLAAGHDAGGQGAGREKIRTVGFALDLPSILSQARERGTPVVGALKRAGLDGDLRSDLGRSASRDVLVLPIHVFGRCVALLYGDDGDEAVDLGNIGDVLAMKPFLAAALERILVRKKRAMLRDESAEPSQRDTAEPSPSQPSPASHPNRPVPPAIDLSQLVMKRGGWQEDLVDEGWSSSNEGTPAASEKPPRSGSAPSASARPIYRMRSPPPPPQVAAVRPISKNPIAREEAEETPPELTISEEAGEDDAMAALLDEIELSPTPAPAASTGRSTDWMTRPFDPLASSSMAVEPQLPPRSRGHLHDLPPVLIRSDLVDQVIAGGDKGDRALGEILALGEAAIPSVFARFPGPLTVDRNQALGDLPRPADCGPVLRIVAAMRRLALPFLAVRSADADVEVRFWATYLLGELHYADSATALLPRLFDENTPVRRIAVRSARALVAGRDEAGLPLRKTLERMVALAEEPEQRRLTAVWTMGELKLYRSIPTLIAALSDPLESISDAALRALAAMTRQEFGKEPKKWSEWWDTKGRKKLT